MTEENNNNDNNIISCLANSRNWAVSEARRIVEYCKKNKKDSINFETGYGPSGLPHIGTFCEVFRTKMVEFSLNQIAPEIKTRLICFSDDMDGLRKLPENIPNIEEMRQYLKMPLCNIPDPFSKYRSYADYMNNRLKEFLDSFNFEYEFKCASESYKNGEFDEALLKLLHHYDEVMGVVLPTLREKRSKDYNVILPICPETGRVLEKGVKSIDKKKGTVRFINEAGKEFEIPVTGGNCKLQWKADFGMRWYALAIDYEICGKDVMPSAEIADRICAILSGKSAPILYQYELFLDQNGQKISKSKGNGIAVEDWLKYAPEKSLAYYMFLKPQTAKRLYFDVIPKAVDEYVTLAKKYPTQEEKLKVENPVWYINYGKSENIYLGNLSFALLLNLVSACNPENKKILWGFLKKYDENLTEDNKFLSQLMDYALNYYKDFILPNKQYKTPNEQEKDAIILLKKELINLNQTAQHFDSKTIQNLIYDIGNQAGFDLKEWFKSLYQILLGQETGPRMGSFIELYGIDSIIKLIEEKLNLK